MDWGVRSWFSTGTNEMIERDLDKRTGDKKPEERIVTNPAFDPKVLGTTESDVQPFEVENTGWSIVGVARGEEYRVLDDGVEYVETG